MYFLLHSTINAFSILSCLNDNNKHINHVLEQLKYKFKNIEIHK